MAALSSTSGSRPSFTPDLEGVYTATVTVNDGTRSSSASVRVTVQNNPPIARAGADRETPRNVPARLYGNLSSDVDKDPLTFAWTFSAPPGSTASLSDPSAAQPEFTPDLLGQYSATLTVSDGTLTSQDTVTLTAVNTAPYPRITGTRTVNAGDDAAASAAASSDLNSDPLTFTWYLQKPGGSGTMLSGDGTEVTFRPDVAGSYTVSVDVYDGYATRRASWTTTVLGRITRLNHDVVFAEYVDSLESIVMVSASPANALFVFDPATNLETSVALPGAPKALDVSTDGTLAVVARHGAITIVTLPSLETSDCPVQYVDATGPVPYEVTDVATGATVTLTGKGGSITTVRYAHVTVSTGFSTGLGSVNLATCALGALWRAPTPYDWKGKLHLRPATELLYAADTQSHMYRFDVSGGAATWLDQPVGSGADELWFYGDGMWFLTKTCYVSESDPNTTYLGKPALRGIGYLSDHCANEGARHAAFVNITRQVSVIPNRGWGWGHAEDRQVHRYDGTLALRQATPLTEWVIEDVSYPSRGRFVFYSRDSLRRYVILEGEIGDTLTLPGIAPLAP